MSPIATHTGAASDSRTPPTAPEVAIVEDDRSLRAALVRALHGHGIPATPFESAEAFLDATFGAKMPDCLVLDIHLGGMSGFDLHERLRSEQRLVPTVFITAHEDIPDRRGVGPWVCLRKPFDPGALISLLRPHLGARVR